MTKAVSTGELEKLHSLIRFVSTGPSPKQVI